MTKQLIFFVYLGSNIKSIEKDIDVGKRIPWTAANKVSCVWKPNVLDNMKQQARLTVESALLYGSTTWMLYAILNID